MKIWIDLCSRPNSRAMADSNGATFWACSSRCFWVALPAELTRQILESTQLRYTIKNPRTNQPIFRGLVWALQILSQTLFWVLILFFKISWNQTDSGLANIFIISSLKAAPKLFHFIAFLALSSSLSLSHTILGLSLQKENSFLSDFDLKTLQEKSRQPHTLYFTYWIFHFFFLFFRSFFHPTIFSFSFSSRTKNNKKQKKKIRVASTGWAWWTWAFVWCSPLWITAARELQGDSTKPIPNPVLLRLLSLRYISPLSSFKAALYTHTTLINYQPCNRYRFNSSLPFSQT